MITGMIGPHGRPGFLHPHAHGVINLIGPRKFTVDEKAPRVVDAYDKDGQPVGDLVLTRAVFDDIRAAIKDGAAIALEPIAGDEGDDPRDAHLERMRAEFDRAWGERGEKLAVLQADHDKAQAELGTARARIADLERQLADKSKKKPAAE